jgi:hypothetical protein
MTSPELEAFARAISRVLGWAYFLSWVRLLELYASRDQVLTQAAVW